MISKSSSFTVPTRGKGLYGLTDRVIDAVRQAGIRQGTVTVFVRHTSASIVLFENADPTAASDLMEFFERIVPEDAEGYVHTAEGPDDMTSHIRMVLTRSSEVIPVMDGHPALGTWQGVYLFEHRRAPHRREVVINVTGCV